MFDVNVCPSLENAPLKCASSSGTLSVSRSGRP
jgi:hypothetical protein